MARDTYKYHFKMGNKIVTPESLTIWIGVNRSTRETLEKEATSFGLGMPSPKSLR